MLLSLTQQLHQYMLVRQFLAARTRCTGAQIRRPGQTHISLPHLLFGQCVCKVFAVLCSVNKNLHSTGHRLTTGDKSLSMLQAFRYAARSALQWAL